MSTIRQCLVIAALAVIAGSLTGVFHPRAPAYRSSPGSSHARSVEQVRALGTETFLWIDARSEADYAISHVPGAIHLNEDDWESGFEQLFHAWQPDQPILVYCDAFACQASEAVAQRLRRELATDAVYYLEGGWQAWKDQP